MNPDIQNVINLMYTASHEPRTAHTAYVLASLFKLFVWLIAGAHGHGPVFVGD